MTAESRRQIIASIEAIRGRRLIAYVTSTRPGINAPVDAIDLRVIQEHLITIPPGQPIDIFIITYGGAANLPWALACLLREHSTSYDVLVPYQAFSAGTSICLGADHVVMTKMGTLGPVDPSVFNE